MEEQGEASRILGDMAYVQLTHETMKEETECKMTK